MGSIEETIERQRNEAARLIGEAFVERDTKLNGIDAKIAKIVVGPRRAGKSMLALQSIKGMRYAYANLDDEGLQGIAGNYDPLLKGISAVYGNFDVLLLDEIQNLANWQFFVNRLERQGYNLLITGSNSNLLSSELASHLTGRYLETLVLPFSFVEFLRAKGFSKDAYKAEGEGMLVSLLKTYFSTGGYPEVVVKGLGNDYIRLLAENTIYVDIVKRHKVRKPEELHSLFSYLLDIYSKEFTYDSAADATGIKSVNTVKKYTGHLEEAYLVFELRRFEAKAKLRQKAPRKIYAIDLGLISAYATKMSGDYGRLIENLVAIELLRKNEKVMYWKDQQGNEVDFVVLGDTGAKALMQSCYDISDRKVKERETRSLLKASEQLHCSNMQVITWDYEGNESVGGKTIAYIPLWKWLLQSSL